MTEVKFWVSRCSKKEQAFRIANITLLSSHAANTVTKTFSHKTHSGLNILAGYPLIVNVL